MQWWLGDGIYLCLQCHPEVAPQKIVVKCGNDIVNKE